MALERTYGALTCLLGPVAFDREGTNLIGTLAIRELITVSRVEATWRVEWHFHLLADRAAVQSFVSRGRAHRWTINFAAVELGSIA